MNLMPDNSVAGVALRMLQETPLCDRCLGRLFAWLGTGTTNQERGRSIKLTLLMDADRALKSGEKDESRLVVSILASNGMYGPARLVAEGNGIEYETRDKCYLCTLDDSSPFDEIPKIAEDIIQGLDSLEFETFLVGSIPSPSLVERQDELNARYSLSSAETLKAHFNRELGRYLQRALDREVDFEGPDVVFIYDMEQRSVKTQINPVFIAGRYRKLKRGIPQSRWDCKACGGRGCKECHGTGRRYQDSISECIGLPSQEMLGGSKFKFHAAGREDVDVLMLGDGRPFVVEVSEPRVRRPDLVRLAKKINRGARKKVEVIGLELTSRKKLQQLKAGASSNIKEYHAIVETGRDLTSKDIVMLQERFRDIDIEQRTPHRVSHRRSDLVRIKHVYEIRAKRKKRNRLELFFRVQGGTYIKELVSGDEGRTSPSVAEVLGTSCVCTTLNVTAIYGEETT
ncbi:MAG: tRNA pseudouridine(54/55) synthase Pus10 [Candidatus Thorarchaeota archaeon]|nr:MAG: tRNA pseudouridine(54/55) synthase Pus10 [Candidatus Thorarchaeota archaeon]RLI59640.1 MAG: tRNA pseudouridine(54/55) synthase Pus10 [Candidatus Thorarchaeota archaeon]